MGGLVSTVLASNSLNTNRYSTRKGFSQTREKVVDLKRKKFGGSSSAKLLLLNLNCFFVTRLNLYVEAKAILQKEHITLLRKKAYAFGAFWRISLVTLFETLTFLTYCKGRPRQLILDFWEYSQ